MKKLGLDIGDVRIGVAVSDLLGMLANPRETYKRKSIECDIEYFRAMVKAENVDTVVLGLPVNMNGTEGIRVETVRAYGDALTAAIPEITVTYIDERMTTMQAERALIAGDMRRDKRKTVIDQAAACIILQTYLDKKGN